MRLLLTIAFAGVFALNLFSQTLPVDENTKKITFQETVNIDTLSKDELFTRSKEWMTKFYSSSTFDVKDATAGKLAREGYFLIYLTYDFKYKSENNVAYKISIDIKEGKYRYTLTEFAFYNTKSGSKTSTSLEAAIAKMSTQNKGEANTQIKAEVEKIIADLKVYMASGEKKNEDDW